MTGIEKTNSILPSGQETEQNLAALSEQSQLLYRELAKKKERLAQMLYGAWSVLENIRGAESLVHCAHSARELMEKAPIDIPDVPVEQGSGNLTNEVRSLHVAWQQIKAASWANTPPWQGQIDALLSNWLQQAETFFTDFSTAHQTRNEQIRVTITSLDQTGRPVPTNLIAEKVKQWSELRDYFVNTAHHRKPTDEATLRANLSRLEAFLLNLIYPQPIPDMDEVDALIAEGETP